MIDFEFKENYTVDDLRAIMKILRGENGCPWDKEQTHQSIRRNFIEETYEVCEAIDTDDKALLQEELGDVLLQVIFHSQMEEEINSFTFDNVVTDICKKLIIRHPHIFADVSVKGVDDVLTNWNNIKQATKGQTKPSQSLISVAKQLPALMRAQKVQERAEKANPIFGYSDISAVLSDLKSEISELEDALDKSDADRAEEIGDILFAAVNAAKYFHYDAETLLTSSTDKFINRFAEVERLAEAKGVNIKTADGEALDFFWNEVKKLSNSRGNP